MTKLVIMVNEDLIKVNLIEVKDILKALNVSSTTWVAFQKKGIVSLKTLKKISSVTKEPLSKYIELWENIVKE